MGYPNDIAISDLTNATLDELMREAQKKRNEKYLNYITYSPKAFFPLTQLCRDKCGYCTFAKAPKFLNKPFMEPAEILELAKMAEGLNCGEALFTLGEKPEYRYKTAQKWLKAHGFNSTIDYLTYTADIVTTETSLLAHLNPGTLSIQELLKLKTVSVSQGMMLETVEDLNCHKNCPDKVPLKRIKTLINAGKAKVPFTTGILVGIGESAESRIKSLLVIAKIHERYGHIQEVIIQNFLPKEKTLMANHPPCDPEEFLKTIAIARLILPEDIHLQAPPNLFEDVLALTEAGIDDLGGISPLTIDYVNPEKAWPNVESLKKILKTKGLMLLARLAVYPEFIYNKDSDFIAENLRSKVLKMSDSLGLKRQDNWSPGSNFEPKSPLKINLLKNQNETDELKSDIKSILNKSENNEELSEKDIIRLFKARDSEINLICEYADQLRQQIVGPVVTYVFNRNINYTNICTFKCRFCAFSKGPLSLNLRGDPYLLSIDEIRKKALEAYKMGATELCLQGGIHPKFDGNYYLNVVKAIKEEVPDIHIHAFSALEIYQGAMRLGVDLRDYLLELKKAGLKSLPGTAAEILDDKVRKILCPDKITTSQWLEVHETAHSVGLKSNVTIMFGSVEYIDSWAKHLILTRDLAKKTHGFTEFVPLPFVHMGSPVFIMGKTRRGPTFEEVILMHAIGRIVYKDTIKNIQASWVKLGRGGLKVLLKAGVNDLGGTLIEENISRAAGASHGQFFQRSDFQELLDGMPDRYLAQRSTLYEILEPV